MSKLILLDTNFLFGKRLESEYIQKFKENDIDVYISQIILDELKGQNIREIKLAYDKINKAISETKYAELYFNIKDNTDIEEVFKESDSRMDNYFGKIFGDHIIPLPDKNEAFDILLDRSKRKTPPFYDEKGASDKGFKDTLIWIDFLNFCKENKYEEYYLVSRDNGFSKYSTAIRAEFKSSVGSDNFDVLQFTTLNELHNHFIKDVNLKEEDLTVELPFEEDKKITSNDIDRESIQKVKSAVHELLKRIEYDDFNEYEVSNINLHRFLNDEDTVKFCDSLANKKAELVFFDSFDIFSVLSDLDIEGKRNYEVEISNVMNFIEIWEMIKNKFPSYKDAFIKFLRTELNRLVIIEDISLSEDLPF